MTTLDTAPSAYTTSDPQTVTIQLTSPYHSTFDRAHRSFIGTPEVELTEVQASLPHPPLLSRQQTSPELRRTPASHLLCSSSSARATLSLYHLELLHCLSPEPELTAQHHRSLATLHLAAVPLPCSLPLEPTFYGRSCTTQVAYRTAILDPTSSTNPLVSLLVTTSQAPSACLSEFGAKQKSTHQPASLKSRRSRLC